MNPDEKTLFVVARQQIRDGHRFVEFQAILDLVDSLELRVEVLTDLALKLEQQVNARLPT